MTITKELPCRLLHRQGMGGVGSLQPVPQNVLRLPGVGSNYASTLDSPAISVIGDIDIRVKLSLDVWKVDAGGKNQNIVSKWTGPPGRSYRLAMGSGGFPFFSHTSDGTTQLNDSGPTAVSYTNGQIGWLRVTRVSSTGSVQFYTSNDGLTWSTLGTAVAGTSGDMYDGVAALELGSRDSGADPIAGYIFYAEVRSGINGPVVAAFDPSTAGVTGDRTPSTLTSRSLAESVRLPGWGNLDFISTPATPLNTVTGDIDIRVKLATDWATASGPTAGNRTIISMHTGANGWELRSRAGDLSFEYYYTGGGGAATRSSTAHSLADWAIKWVRVTRVVATGVTAFYMSDDGATWTPIGTGSGQVGLAMTIPSTPLRIGKRGDGLALPGFIYSAEVRSGINGTVVARFDAAGTDVTGVRVPSTVGNIDGSVWTLNGVAWRWAVAPGQSSTGALRLAGLAATGTDQARVTTPDAVDISITGDIDVRVQVALDDWTPAVASTLMSKWDSGTQRTFVFYIDVSGNPTLGYSLDGTAQLFATASVTNGIPDGTVKWVRFTRNATTGDVIFYTSDDNVTYTQLGTTQTGTVGALFDSTSTLNIGADNNTGGRQANEYLFRAEVYNGIAGTLVAWFDTSSIPAATNRTPTTVVQSGRTWTLNGTLWTWVNLANLAVWTMNGTNWWWADSAYTPYQNGIILDPQYVRFDGTAGNYASTPDSAALSITGDIDLRAKISADTFATGTSQTILAKYISSTNQRSYMLRLETDGQLGIWTSSDGTASGAHTRPITGFTAGSVFWVRGTRVAATGVCTLYVSSDGVAWTQLGTTGVIQAGSGIFDSTAEVAVAARDTAGATERLAGKVYYAEVRNGVAGSIVGSFGAHYVRITGVRTPTSNTDLNGNIWTFNGSTWAWGPSTATALITTPDTAALSITGDIDLRIKATLTDWLTVPIQSFLANRGSNLGYQLRIGFPGFLSMVWGNGTANVTANSTVVVPFNNGQIGWVRSTLAVATGDVKFYTSSDGVTWTQLGATVTVGVTVIGDATSPLEIGTVPTGGQRLQGTIYYAEIRNGIGGTVVGVFDPNAAKSTGANAPTTIPSRTGEVYTISGSGWEWSAAA